MKINLKLENIYTPDVIILGIVSNLKPHKFAWLLNKSFEIDFFRGEDISVPFEEERLPFLNFVYESSFSLLRLVRNRSYDNHISNKPFFLPEFKEFDFFLLLENPLETHEANEVMERVKQLINVEYVKEIKIEEVKSVENLIFN